MKENIIRDKSYSFSLRIIKLYKWLIDNKKEYVLGKQLLRSGTSIRANAEEAIGGHSKNDFIYKMSLAYKEARETSYWIKLMRDSEIIDFKYSESILFDCEEVLKILGVIQKTLRKNS